MNVPFKTAGSETWDVSTHTATDPILLDDIRTASVTASIITATALDGMIELQASNDIGQALGGNSGFTGIDHWVTLARSPTSVTDTGNHLWNLPDMGFKYIRLAFSLVSGTATITARINTKV